MSGTVSRGQPGGRGQAGSVSRAGVPLEAPGSGRRCQSRRVAAGLVAVVAAAVVARLAGVPPGPWRAPLVARLGAGRRGASRSPPGRSAPRGLAGGSSRDHTTLRDAGADHPAAPVLGITGAVLPPSAGTARRRRRQLRSLTAASAACALLFTPVRNDCDQAQQRPQIPARRRLKLEIEPKMRQAPLSSAGPAAVTTGVSADQSGGGCEIRTREGLPPTRFPTMLPLVHGGPRQYVTSHDAGGGRW